MFEVLLYSLESKHTKNTVSEGKKHTHWAKECQPPSPTPCVHVMGHLLGSLLQQTVFSSLLWKKLHWFLRVETRQMISKPTIEGQVWPKGTPRQKLMCLPSQPETTTKRILLSLVSGVNGFGKERMRFLREMKGEGRLSSALSGFWVCFVSKGAACQKSGGGYLHSLGHVEEPFQGCDCLRSELEGFTHAQPCLTAALVQQVALPVLVPWRPSLSANLNCSPVVTSVQRAPVQK